MKLFPFQEDGVKFLTTHKEALLADEMGLGKTAQAIIACDKLKARKILIICPASVKYNWLTEFHAWTERRKTTYQILNKRSDRLVSGIEIIIVNYDIIINVNIFKQLKAQQFAVLICDEAHYLKNLKSKRTRAILGKNGLHKNAVYKYMLTGTPVLNRPIELYPMLKTLTPDILGKYISYKSYSYKYCAGFIDHWGYFNNRGASNVPGLNKMLKTVMLRRTKTEVMSELPERRFQKITLEPNESIKKLLRKEIELNGEDKDRVFGEMSTVRQQIALAKLPQCISYVENTLEEVDKLVVFAYHRAVIDALKEQLGHYGVCMIRGDVPLLKRQKEINDFVTDPSQRVFIGQIQAAGQGIDGLQRVASHIIFVESSWVPGEIKQAVDRCHRIGQSKPVLAQFLVVKDSLEDQMFDSVIRKAKIIKGILK